MSIPLESARGLELSDRWRWNFWKRTELNLAEAQQCLDRLETLQPDPGQQAVLAMARAAAPAEASPKSRLAVLRTAMQTLTEQISGDLCPLAGIALTLRARSEQAVEAELVAQLPPTGVLGEVAPEPGWLLEHAAQPYPHSAQEWSKTLDQAPPESVSRALERLAPPDVQVFLRQTASLDLQARPALERETLGTFDQPLSGPDRAARFLQGQLEDQDVLKLGAWLSGTSSQPLSKLARELDHPQAYRTLARHLDQPDWLTPAAGELASRVPPRQLADCLSRLAPGEPTLAWLARLPEDAAARTALEAFAEGERSRPALLLELPLPPAEALAMVDSPEPLLKALAGQTWSDAAGQARAVAVGWKALEQDPGNLAGAGLAMARSTRDVNAKLFLAQSTLKALGAEDLLALTRVEGPNQEWSQAALALAALRHLDKGAAPGPQLTFDLLREACDSWAAPPWREALLQHLTRDPALGPLAQSLLAAPETLTALGSDRLLASTLVPMAPAGVAELDRAVILGGVRLAKRGVASEAGQPVAVGRAAAGDECPLELGPPPEPGRRVQVTWFERLHRGVGAAYNPLTGQVESRERLNRGVAAVFNPRLGKVEFHEAGSRCPAAGCFDPARGEAHFKSGARLMGLSVVYNPATKSIQEQTGARRYGVSGVFNPASGEVEWKSARERGYGAVFNPESGKLEWREKKHRGTVAVSDDPEFPTLAGASYAPEPPES